MMFSGGGGDAMTSARSFTYRSGGQSLVEIALALPLLLITLLGVVDVGRAYVYTTTVTNAAREAALYASKTPTATLAQVTQRACDETGFTSYGAACATGIAVTCAWTSATGSTSACPSSGSYVTVNVSYEFALVGAYVFERLLGRNTLTAAGTASFRSLQ
jgi:Flp pilus assembly protein TadG